MFIEILFKMLLFKGGVLIYAVCMYIYIYVYIEDTSDFVYLPSVIIELNLLKD